MLQPTDQPTPVRSWPVRATGILLLLQTAILLGSALHLLAQIDWSSELQQPRFSPAALETIILAGVQLPLALLALLAAIGFAFLVPSGWLLAMIVEGASLLIYLILYFTQRPGFIYPLMLYAIIMVLYLNSFDVRVAFHATTALPELEANDEQ